MQTTQNILPDQLEEVLRAVYADGSPIVKDAYSNFDQPLRTFGTIDELRDDLSYSPGQRQAFFYYSIYYPAAGGLVTEKRIDLKPGAVPGHTHRYTSDGWGLIQLQCNFGSFPLVECRVAVNSDARARAWSKTYPELESPDLWNWNEVERHASRLVRLLRKLGKRAG